MSDRAGSVPLCLPNQGVAHPEPERFTVSPPVGYRLQWATAGYSGLQALLLCLHTQALSCTPPSLLLLPGYRLCPYAVSPCLLSQAPNLTGMLRALPSATSSLPSIHPPISGHGISSFGHCNERTKPCPGSSTPARRASVPQRYVRVSLGIHIAPSTSSITHHHTSCGRLISPPLCWASSQDQPYGPLAHSH